MSVVQGDPSPGPSGPDAPRCVNVQEAKTHLSALLEPQKLSPELHNALEDSTNTLVVSAASAWEIATKWRLGKLQHARSVVDNYAMALHHLAAVDLPISGAVARQAGLMAVPHREPFDRLLAAHARPEDLVLASTDPAFTQSQGC